MNYAAHNKELHHSLKLSEPTIFMKSDRIDYRGRNQGFVELYPVPYPCAGRYRGAKYLYVCPSCCDVQPLEFNQSLIYENNSRRNELCCSQ